LHFLGSDSGKAHKFGLGHRPVGYRISSFGLDRQAGRAQFQHRQRRWRILGRNRWSQGFHPLNLFDKTLMLRRDLPGKPVGFNGFRSTTRRCGSHAVDQT